LDRETRAVVVIDQRRSGADCRGNRMLLCSSLEQVPKRARSLALLCADGMGQIASEDRKEGVGLEALEPRPSLFHWAHRWARTTTGTTRVYGLESELNCLSYTCISHHKCIYISLGRRLLLDDGRRIGPTIKKNHVQLHQPATTFAGRHGPEPDWLGRECWQI